MKTSLLFVGLLVAFIACSADKVDQENAVAEQGESEHFHDSEPTNEKNSDPLFSSRRPRYRLRNTARRSRLLGRISRKIRKWRPWNIKRLRNKIIKKLLMPTCLGCAGICERKVPGKCRCYTDSRCLRKWRGDEEENELVEEQDPLMWGKVLRWTLKPTCAGCAGICERKVPGRCACTTDYSCLNRRGDQVLRDVIDGKMKLEDDDEEEEDNEEFEDQLEENEN